MNEDQVMRTRQRYREALRVGMTIPEASAYANEQSSFGNNTQAALASAPASVVGPGNVRGGSGESNGSVAAPLSPKLALSRASENTDHDETMNPERLVHPDHAVSQAQGQGVAALSEGSSSGPSAANSEGSRERTAAAPGNCTEYKVGRNRLSNGRWPAGVSGNPKGRKPKNNDFDGPNELEQALDQKIKITQGGKRRVITRRTALREQMINQAIKGDHRARRDLIACADKRGIDLFAGQHKAIREAIAAAARSSSDLTLSEEVLDRLSAETLDKIIRVVNEVTAEKKKEID